MAKVVLYTTAFCPFCHRAKALLEAKGVAYEEIDVTFSPAKRAEMKALANGRSTVPQIWIDDQHVGGSDDLYALDRAGKLDPLLGTAA
ncbi:MAG TPA: glutaredoxin 3 [Alphaproteobacteria bacterium]